MQILRTMMFLFLSVTAVAETICYLQVSPVPAYHALGEDDLHSMDHVMGESLLPTTDGGSSTVGEEGGIKILDQATMPSDGSNRRSLKNLKAAARTDHRDLQMSGGRWIWYSRACTDCCRGCNGENGDGRRSLEEVDDMQIEGSADGLLAGILESGIASFANADCVVVTCDGSDVQDYSSGCL
jgi:hypothetical protein